MKRLLLVLGSAVSIATPLSVAVACGKKAETKVISTEDIKQAKEALNDLTEFHFILGRDNNNATLKDDLSFLEVGVLSNMALALSSSSSSANVVNGDMLTVTATAQAGYAFEGSETELSRDEVIKVWGLRESPPVKEHETIFSTDTLDISTDYKLNTTKMPWLTLETHVANNMNNFLALFAQHASDLKSTIDGDVNRLDFDVWLTDVPAQDSRMRLSVPLQTRSGDSATMGDLSQEEIHFLIVEQIFKRSVEKSEGSVENPSPPSGAKLNLYWNALDSSRENILGVTAVNFSSLTWSSWETASTFDILKTAAVDIKHPDDGTISKIDGTSVALRSDITLPAGVQLRVLDFYRDKTDQAIINNVYDFRLDSEMLYQNIYLTPEFSNPSDYLTKYIPAQHLELLEIIKLGNGLSTDMIERRLAYNQNDNVFTKGETHE